eukprot:CAMPEP_0197686970 /NCGR_PEP_ID=MMETSP1338-20131121/103321_1 /TAXON_ID=43686 ORGANISM="Pelagodinium beii, Strain RCC1491" /NCGR_SAMPLE_ID=MMETSP1338 /ASSEMBLY_ACC=CAM_ASM_000754 /LENGTH=34 /DNA_ID= /DNA_START= /DNA_END= /DNA_ORIENTATION=
MSISSATSATPVSLGASALCGFKVLSGDGDGDAI